MLCQEVLEWAWDAAGVVDVAAEVGAVGWEVSPPLDRVATAFVPNVARKYLTHRGSHAIRWFVPSVALP